MKMCKIDHYMVDFENAATGSVEFANDTHLHDLHKARLLARKVSRKHGSAAVIAYEATSVVMGSPTYLPVGDIKFTNGYESDRNGCVAA
jgi:hypothetical protein